MPVEAAFASNGEGGFTLTHYYFLQQALLEQFLSQWVQLVMQQLPHFLLMQQLLAEACVAATALTDNAANKTSMLRALRIYNPPLV